MYNVYLSLREQVCVNSQTNHLYFKKSCMKKKLVTLLVLFVALCAIKTTAQSSLIPKFGLSKEDKLVSTQFISLQGSDRLEHFVKLMPLIKTEAINLVRPISTLDDVIEYLGNPDAILTGNFYQYNLKTSASNCKAIIKIDKEGNVVFVSLKDCP